MKFGKEFIRVIEQTQPEFRDKFLCYKQLKKSLKQLPDTSAGPEGGTDTGASAAAAEHKRELTPAERDFVRALNAELSKFNEFFMEKEEELVMMEKALADRATALSADPSPTAASLSACCHALAKFHGELVLLEHWCSLNYAALVKILKKHDKRSSLSLRLPILVNVLRQPFYSTEILSQLVRSTEQRFHTLAGRLREVSAAAGSGAGAPPEGEEPPPPPPTLMQLETPSVDAAPAPDEEASMLARTRAALSCWEELKKSQSLGPQPAWPLPSGDERPAAAADDDDDDDSSRDEGEAKRQKN